MLYFESDRQEYCNNGGVLNNSSINGDDSGGGDNLTFQLDFIHFHIKILTYLFTYSFDGAEAFLRS